MTATMIPNVLITDDDSAFRHVLREGLSSRGYGITEASNGQEAIEKIAQSKVHFVLLDHHMPRLTGLEVMQQLTQTPHSPPCVLMSAQLDDDIRREAAKMKAYQVLSKPIRLAELRDLVLHGLAEIYGWRPGQR